jgi:hypothetical protein
MSSNNSSSAGLGLPSVLLVVFVVLKLIGIIDWSWLWVLSPFWIELILVVIIATYFYVDKTHFERKWRKK